MSFDRALPPTLAELHRIRFDYFDAGIEYEPYDQFLPLEENQAWIRAWLADENRTGQDYRVFGQDATGGYVAFWLVRPDHSIESQPVAFFGSEGDVGVVARNLPDYLWLLAEGVGPMEAIEDGVTAAKSVEVLTAFASQHALKAKKTAAEVLGAAQAEFPDFAKDFRARGV